MTDPQLWNSQMAVVWAMEVHSEMDVVVAAAAAAAAVVVVAAAAAVAAAAGAALIAGAKAASGEAKSESPSPSLHLVHDSVDREINGRRRRVAQTTEHERALVLVDSWIAVAHRPHTHAHIQDFRALQTTSRFFATFDRRGRMRLKMR